MDMPQIAHRFNKGQVSAVLSVVETASKLHYEYVVTLIAADSAARKQIERQAIEAVKDMSRIASGGTEVYGLFEVVNVEPVDLSLGKTYVITIHCD